MTLAQLRASLEMWRRRHSYRHRRLSALERRARREREQRGRVTAGTQAKLDEMVRLTQEAHRMVERRKRQIARRSGPRIITARQLGLTFQYLWGGKGSLDSLAGHYDAGPKVNGDRELVARARQIHGYHHRIGMGGAAYEALVAGRTIVFLNPMDRKSAGVAGQNTGLANICVPGTTGDRMDATTRRTVEWLVANWHTTRVPKAHRLPRRARSVVRLGHKEFPGQSTACPGDYLPDYRKAWA